MDRQATQISEGGRGNISGSLRGREVDRVVGFSERRCAKESEGLACRGREGADACGEAVPDSLDEFRSRRRVPGRPGGPGPERRGPGGGPRPAVEPVLAVESWAEVAATSTWRPSRAAGPDVVRARSQVASVASARASVRSPPRSRMGRGVAGRSPLVRPARLRGQCRSETRWRLQGMEAMASASRTAAAVAAVPSGSAARQRLVATAASALPRRPGYCSDQLRETGPGSGAGRRCGPGGLASIARTGRGRAGTGDRRGRGRGGQLAHGGSCGDRPAAPRPCAAGPRSRRRAGRSRARRTPGSSSATSTPASTTSARDPARTASSPGAGPQQPTPLRARCSASSARARWSQVLTVPTGRSTLWAISS